MHLNARGDHIGVGELFIELVVEFSTISDEHEGPVPGLSSKHLLGEPQHR